MAAVMGAGRQTLHVEPTDMYNKLSGPKAMYFHV
jgi:hypothetical protein